MTTWTAYVDFGVVHSLAFPECRGGEGPIIETLEQIVADATFGAVEIAPIKDPAVRKRAEALLAAAAMQVVYLPILPIIFEDLGIGNADETVRRVAKERLFPMLDEAIAFGAPLAMINGPRDPGPDARTAETSRLVEDIRELCDYADARSKHRRLHITLENFDRDIEKKRLIGPTIEAAALVEAVDRENFGLTIDLSHLPLLGETTHHALQTAAPHLIHAHIGNCVIANPDCPFYGDFHPRFGHPEGCNDELEVIEFLRELDSINYWARARNRLGGMPILSMEVKPTPTDNEGSATVLANGKRVFMRAWAQARLSA